MSTLRAEPFAKLGAQLGEGPAWDSENGLSVVDILSGRLYSVDSHGRCSMLVELNRALGAAIPSQRTGEYLLLTRDGFAVLRADGSVVDLLRALDDRPDLRFNDAKCDEWGRCFAGTLSLVDAVGDGTLYRLDPGPELATLVEGVGLSNGLGWAPSGRTFYFTDTVSGRIDQFTYDMQTGAATERRPFVAELPGTPDGLCVDSDGCVWIALWGGHAVRRYTPRGQLDAIVEVPVPNVTSCAFGGDVLYITTAAAGLRPEEFPHAGDIFAVDAGVSGPSVSKWKPVGLA